MNCAKTAHSTLTITTGFTLGFRKFMPQSTPRCCLMLRLRGIKDVRGSHEWLFHSSRLTGHTSSIHLTTTACCSIRLNKPSRTTSLPMKISRSVFNVPPMFSVGWCNLMVHLSNLVILQRHTWSNLTRNRLTLTPSTYFQMVSTAKYQLNSWLSFRKAVTLLYVRRSLTSREFWRKVVILLLVRRSTPARISTLTT